MTEQDGTVTATRKLEPVRHAVTVPLAPGAAFALFTGGFNSWWPGHHIGAAELDEAIIEPRSGGRWYERGVDGSECDWGIVLDYDPPARLLLRWQLDGEWQYDPDPEHGSEVEVSFTPGGQGTTTVCLEHRNFERHGAQGQAVHDGVGDGGGWSDLLGLYRAKAAAGEQAAG